MFDNISKAITIAEPIPHIFRVKIWNKASGTMVYDNIRGASDDIDLENPQAISGGIIVIKK